MQAALRNNLLMAEALLAAGAKVRDQKSEALVQAVRLDNLPMAQALLAYHMKNGAN